MLCSLLLLLLVVENGGAAGGNWWLIVVDWSRGVVLVGGEWCERLLWG